ncbi:hypothetical protein [Flagellimonas pacifica]|uniref:Uncharacterized protein n=1 Tax=Flagellimonas pacifica TaxID=1247520 RepID=A0A285MUU7_9FLAO|nr:hypothetical protein [Allomuricauda parva]SNZ00969.1 hypothetical protein SAMN06265377_2799 [Allomuricauda parva]
MAGTSIARALGVLIESFSDFLQRLFEGNGQVESNERDLKNSLKNQAELKVDDLLVAPWSNLRPKLDKLDTKILDRAILFIYNKAISTDSSTRTNSDKTTDLRILDLIEYLDINRTEFSLDRNNIKNSLQHNL